MEEDPDLLKDFGKIIGGKYDIKKTPDNTRHFIPKGGKVKLNMGESSSAVRSLSDIGLYLRRIARKGDILMIDEPELNLHPENQRRPARLFVNLVNIGVRVFITTHSDYLIKEFNTLILLERNQEKEHIKRLMEKEKYKQEELLDLNRINVYTAEKRLFNERDRRIRGNTLICAAISPETGIEATSFDSTIDEMNRIQDEILWGGE